MHEAFWERVIEVTALAFIEDVICGGLAAAGFGVLFNIALRSMPWCFASGALALAVRSLALVLGLRFEAASFFAALALGIAVYVLPFSAGVSRNVLRVVGSIPLIPGAFAARAVLGLFAMTTPQPFTEANDTLVTAVTYLLRVGFTLGALGTGLAIPTLLLRSSQTKATT